jgi:hypothetical protein
MEISLLIIAITLFSVSAFFYSYYLVEDTVSFGISLSSYPYRTYALGLVGVASFLMLTASISFSKRSKNLRRKTYQI